MVMNGAAPQPGGGVPGDPDGLAAAVAAALHAVGDDAELTEQLRTLEELHQRLAAALTTIDGA
jgi:ribulose 1,5-bisphosphate carboxylase large subunit-like protein